MRSIALLVGARPNYMKVFPIWRELNDRHREIRAVLIHTEQHYDDEMSKLFFNDFGMPPPDYSLGIGSGPHGDQTGRTMSALEQVLAADRPAALVVVGDVNSTLAGALVATKMHIPTAHVEAGLRSGDRTMPEEVNRLATDAICDLLLTPSRDADANLRREGIPDSRRRFVGNVMIDSLVQLLPKSAASTVLADQGVEPREFALVTLHRPSNVDDPQRLATIMEQLEELADQLPVVFPVHPFTQRKMAEFDWAPAHSKIKTVPPLGYLDFLRLESEAALVVTDSGGVQEETTFMGVPCITLRPNTERPITLELGTNRLVDPAAGALREHARAAIAARPATPPHIELWDGSAAGRVCTELIELIA